MTFFIRSKNKIFSEEFRLIGIKQQLSNWHLRSFKGLQRNFREAEKCNEIRTIQGLMNRKPNILLNINISQMLS